MKIRFSSIQASALVLAVVCIFTATASAAIIRVKPDGDDAHSGSSWALAKKTVQAAIDAAAEGDEIWVATGIYPEHIKNKVLNETIDPIPINVALYGGFAGTETARDQRNWMTNLTVLDGGGGAAPSPPAVGSVVHITGGAGRTTRVDGFVITRGHAIAGGGVLIEGSGPTVVNNNLWLNSASIGGGIGVSNYDFVPPTISHPVITDNRIYGNSAVEGGGGIAVVGAARLVSYDPAAPLISRNTISQNSCVKNGGGIGCWGHTAASITGNFIVGNVAASDEASFAGGGGGIYATSRDLDDQPISYAICAPRIFSNAVTANGGFLGAGIYCWDTDDAHGGIPVITNNTITSNNGIGVYWKASSPVITNNIVAFNPWGLQQPAEAPTSPTISHNCIYGNSARGKRTDYNSIADQTGLNGNISIDPLLANVRLGEVRIQPNSPCREAGSPSAVSTSWKDIQGEDRVQGDNVDIGADESNGTSWDISTPVIHVRPDGNDAEDGTTWAKAKKTVGAGATAAFMGGGGEVWVAEGTYVERVALTAFTYLYGGFAGTETSRDQRDIGAHPTILDGDGVPNVITVAKAGFLMAAIDGFTIRNGGTFTNGTYPFTKPRYAGRGGGIDCRLSSPLIENNIITQNSVGNPINNAEYPGYGGGLYIYMFFGSIRGNAFTQNEVINTFDGSGGGIYCNFSMPTIQGNSFTLNHAPDGAAIFATMSMPDIIGNTIETNDMYVLTPLYNGATNGAVFIYMNEDFLVQSNTIKGNTAAAGAGLAVSTNWAGKILNNLITGNVAENAYHTGGMGGGIFASVQDSATEDLLIANNTIVGNTATLLIGSPPSNEQGGGVALSFPYTGVASPPAKLVMANNIVAFNSSGVWHYPWSPMLVPTLENNDVYGSTSGYNYISLSPGATDISLDPVFISAPSGGYHLQLTSPCVDGGGNSRVPSVLTADFDGRPRIIDGNGDASAVVDMGIFEYTSGTDADAPTVTITSPTGNATYVTSQAVIDLSGTASDNVGITGVTWANDRGGGGTCDGTANWTADGILLFIGQNVITVTARDRTTGGNAGTDVITITYTLPVTISGYVSTAGGSPVSGVIMDGLPSTPSTDVSGYYSDPAVPSGWSGTIEPLKTGWVFDPPSRTYTNIAVDQVNQNYTGSGGLAVPSVTTVALTSVTATTATSGGSTTWDGGAAITARGVCWSFVPNPTVSGSHTGDGTGMGSFTSGITGLMAGFTYYVRAYATNSVGTGYGNEISFTTQTKDYAVPFTEAFGLAARPADWTVQVEGDGVEDEWIVGLTNFAGGEANEMMGRYQPAQGMVRLVSPPINTSGYQALELRFRHFLETWDLGGVTLKLQTSPDGVDWTDEAWSVITDPFNLGPELVRTVLSNNLDRETTYIAFVMEGDLFYFENWFIDDLSVKAGEKADFVGTWDGQGVYYRNSDTGGWFKLASPATKIAAGDLDGDGIDDLIGLWPGQGGIWVKYSQSGAWAKLSSTAQYIAAGDMNGDGRIDLVGTWDGQGVFYRNSITGAWVKMASPATMVTAGDIDNDGTDDLIGLWPSQGGIWVKYSSTGAWAKLSSTAVHIAAGDMNGDGRDDLLGTWDGQGVYYRDSVTGAWVKMASPATLIMTGDIDGDATDDLIGIWPTQGGVWVKYSSDGTWERLSSTAQDIAAGKMRAASGGNEVDHSEGALGAQQEFVELPLPMGGNEEGPGVFLNKRDLSDLGPGGARFVYLEHINLDPKEEESTRLNRIPGPGEVGATWVEQGNLFPQETPRKEKRAGTGVKLK
jgi:parallel beta-helix repeat protein